jgi:hypothetical protein
VKPARRRRERYALIGRWLGRVRNPSSCSSLLESPGPFGEGCHGQASRRTAAAHLLGWVRRGHHVRHNPATLKSRWMRARYPALPARRGPRGCGAARLGRLSLLGRHGDSPLETCVIREEKAPRRARLRFGCERRSSFRGWARRLKSITAQRVGIRVMHMLPSRFGPGRHATQTAAVRTFCHGRYRAADRSRGRRVPPGAAAAGARQAERRTLCWA